MRLLEYARGVSGILVLKDIEVRFLPSVYTVYECVCKECGMMTSSNGDIFRITGPLCGEFTGQAVE